MSEPIQLTPKPLQLRDLPPTLITALGEICLDEFALWLDSQPCSSANPPLRSMLETAWKRAWSGGLKSGLNVTSLAEELEKELEEKKKQQQQQQQQQQ